MTDWLITNATLTCDGRTFESDLRVRAGRIDAIAPSLTARMNDRVFDAAGLWCLPGIIDDQVHFREPGLEHKANIHSESRAAVAGGITSYMEMPNTKPPAVTRAALADKYARGARSSLANYAFYMGATNDNLDELKALAPGESCGIKIFMGASTGNMLVDDPKVLEGIFREAPALLITHCEDTPMIDANLARAKAAFGDSIHPREHPNIRSREACLKSSTLAVQLARQHGARLHVLHVSTADELALFTADPIEKKRITAETCVHFLHFDARDYERLGNKIKCNPAIKLESDKRALIAALADGRIDVLATDHAPHTREEKAQPYETAPSGLPLVQHHLQAALDVVFDGGLALATLVERACHAPAKLFGIPDRGYLREGYAADFVLVDPNRPHRVRDADEISKCGWTPFDQHTFRSTVVSTFVNGHRAWHDGRIDDTVLGQRLSTPRGRD